MHNMFDEGFPKKVKDEFIPAIPNDVDAALRWSDHYVYFLKGMYLILRVVITVYWLILIKEL